MGGKRLLLVEDHPEMRSALRLTLEDRGWSVVEVCSGEQAITFWPEVAPDAVITDYRMGNVDGLTLARQIRSKVSIPIVIFTWELTAHLMKEAEEIDVAAVQKDDPDSLITILDQIAGAQSG